LIRSLYWAASLAVALLAAPALAAPPPAPPLEAYGRLSHIEQVAISPDGQRIALIITDGDQRKIIIQQLSDHAVLGGMNAGTKKVRGIQWAGSDNLLLTLSVSTSVEELLDSYGEWFMTEDYDLRTHLQKPLMEGVLNSMNVVAGDPDVRIIAGKPWAFVHGVYFVGGTSRIALFKVDVATATTKLAEEGWDHTTAWQVDADGVAVAETEYDAKLARWVLKVRRGAAWKTIKTLHAAIDRPGIVGLGRDGRSVLIATSDDHRDTLRELPLDADDWGPELTDLEGTSPIFDPATHALIGAVDLVGDDQTYRFFSPADQKGWNAVVKAYAGSRVTLASWSLDRRKLVVLVDSPTEGPAYAMVDLDAHRAVWIGETYQEASAAIAPVSPVAFKAADGTALTGYLTLPPGREPKNLPLVVFPHGGPATRDEPGFDWWAQAMASRGYAVLQVNYRGSDGFGRAFLESGFGQWGRKMQTDLSDGVRYLAAEGNIDPKRVCIVGASYGGYAALAGATLDPGVYRCAVDVSGPADLRGFVKWSRAQHDQSTQRYWLRFMGAEGTGDARLEDISPAQHADRATAPILLIHGMSDTVVPFDQTQTMVNALKAAGKPYELVVLKHEDHWLSRGETRLQMLQATIDFLQRNNPPT
jgi:dipeptidyl aminopeptidase/acylaminoacyl peptidase